MNPFILCLQRALHCCLVKFLGDILEYHHAVLMCFRLRDYIARFIYKTKHYTLTLLRRSDMNTMSLRGDGTDVLKKGDSSARDLFGQLNGNLTSLPPAPAQGEASGFIEAHHISYSPHREAQRLKAYSAPNHYARRRWLRGVVPST